MSAPGLLAIGLCATTAETQSRISPGSMPSAERVAAEIKGTSPMDTAARQSREAGLERPLGGNIRPLLGPAGRALAPLVVCLGPHNCLAEVAGDSRDVGWQLLHYFDIVIRSDPEDDFSALATRSSPLYSLCSHDPSYGARRLGSPRARPIREQRRERRPKADKSADQREQSSKGLS